MGEDKVKRFDSLVAAKAGLERPRLELFDAVSSQSPL
jgi:hypothetical protein